MGATFPVELHLPGIRVVSLAASKRSVLVPFPISPNTFISCCSRISPGHSTRLTLTEMCTSGVTLSLIFAGLC